MRELNILLLADVSQGLGHELAVFERMIKQYELSRQCRVTILKMTMEEIRITPTFIPKEFNENKNTKVKNIVVFWEKLVDCRLLYDTTILKIFSPHPEINVPGTLPLLGFVDHIWHKTKLSIEAFKNYAAQGAHLFTGWTSIDPEIEVRSYENFAHFRGKAANRHSAQILNVWRDNPHYPELRYHFYQELSSSWEEPFEFREWLTCRNIRVMAGKIDRDFYYQQLSECGIHLCLSGVEGFGHYINEARAMSAVVVVIDAPPMNEFINVNSDVLIEPIDRREMGLVHCHLISENEIKVAIDKLLALSQSCLEELGREARSSYLADAQLFFQRSGYLLDLIRSDIN